jgi:Ca2+-binding EF-hand superfamily protein
MKKSVNKIIGVFGIALLTSTSILAQGKKDQKEQKRPTIRQIFKDLDKNEDGKLSIKEVKGPLKEDFKKVDTNEDGFITKKELKVAPKPERKERPRN